MGQSGSFALPIETFGRADLPVRPCFNKNKQSEVFVPDVSNPTNGCDYILRSFPLIARMEYGAKRQLCPTGLRGEAALPHRCKYKNRIAFRQSGFAQD